MFGMGRATGRYGLKSFDPYRPERRVLQVRQLMAAVDEIVAVGKRICNIRAKIGTGAKVLYRSRETTI